MKKIGRPKSENSRKFRINLRITDEEMKRLENASKKYGKSKSEVIRTGILGQCMYAEKYL